VWDPQITIEEVNDPEECERKRAHRERAKKNWDWLQANWPNLTPAAFGKFIAVADQQAYIADDLGAALEWVRTHHPDDSGHIVEYVWPDSGPRIYSGRIC
jgi:hypothetical protein